MIPSATASGEEAEVKGHYHRYKHIYDMAMMVGTNGRSRSPAQFGELAKRAGLNVRKVWKCRGHGGLVELALPGC